MLKLTKYEPSIKKPSHVLPHLAGPVETSAIAYRALTRITYNYHKKNVGVKKAKGLFVHIAGSPFFRRGKTNVQRQ